MPNYDDLRDLYHEYTGHYSGEFAFIEAFTSQPIEWESEDDELEGFLDFMDMFSWADQETGHDKAYWDDLLETYMEYYGVTEQGIDWDLLRTAYDARKG
jgi:hypothetical protein